MAGAAAAKAIKKAEVKKRGLATILGVEPFTPHDLRRTAATHMAGIGISPFTRHDPKRPTWCGYSRVRLCATT